LKKKRGASQGKIEAPRDNGSLCGDALVLTKPMRTGAWGKKRWRGEKKGEGRRGANNPGHGLNKKYTIGGTHGGTGG